MDKRSIIVLVLCFLFIYLYYNILMPKMFPPPKKKPGAAKVENKGQGHEKGAPAQTGVAKAKTKAKKEEPASPKQKELEETLKPVLDFKPEEYNVTGDKSPIITVWTNDGGGLKSATFKDFYVTARHKKRLQILGELAEGEYSLVLSVGPKIDDKQIHQKAEVRRDPSKPGVISFVTTAKGLRIRRTFTLVPDAYDIKCVVRIENPGDRVVETEYVLRAVAGIIPEVRRNRWPALKAVMGLDEGRARPTLIEKPPKKLKSSPFVLTGNILWAGSVNKYFAALLIPDAAKVLYSATAEYLEPTILSKDKMLNQANTMVSYRTRPFTIPGGGAVEHTYTFFLGPKSNKVLSAKKYKNAQQIINYGMFGGISKILLAILHVFYRLVPNYGFGIILLTIFVKLCLFPLTKKSQVSMLKMQKLQPKIAALKEKYKGDKQRMNKAQMELFKEEGVHPMSGCLPMLIQLPVFIALFRALSLSIDLRQAPFVSWITDLSQPDNFMTLGGYSIHLLPILMTISWIVQQHFMPKSSDPNAEMQRKMMSWMPIFFGFLFYSMPSGLVLYWLTNTLLGTGEQYLIRRLTADLRNDAA